MRNFIIIVVGIIVLNAALLYSGGFSHIERQFTPAPTVTPLRPEVIETFKNTLEARVREEIGQPIEGYEPHMFLAVFPGLVPSDFDGVEASVGRYVLQQGRLVYEPDATKLIHSAAKAISHRGMATLYRNVAARAGMDITHGATLTDVMRVLTRE